ncbi:hypothetical protein C8J56DRAFT_1166978 [Mycena floridula]|nr:hypothetical protein C8J56DRAFT_1166978 [Mycena floridula]
MESSDTIQPFPKLPFEIICLIIEEMLEIAPKRAVELVSLSRNIRPIVERALYRCLILQGRSMVRLFPDTTNSRVRADPLFYQTRVKTLCIIEELTTADLQTVFSACSGVQSLAIYVRHIEQTSAMETNDALNALASGRPSPAKLSCDFRWTQRSDGSHRFGLPLFQNVTHLELEVIRREDFDGKRLHCLKQLTHLSLIDSDAMHPETQVPGLPSQLYLADSISVCIVFSKAYGSHFAPLLRILIRSTEPRIVIATLRPDGQEQIRNALWRNLDDVDHFARQWGRREDAQELDMWEEAEEIVKAQQVVVCPLSPKLHQLLKFAGVSLTVALTQAQSSFDLPPD